MCSLSHSVTQRRTKNIHVWQRFHSLGGGQRHCEKIINWVSTVISHSFHASKALGGRGTTMYSMTPKNSENSKQKGARKLREGNNNVAQHSRVFMKRPHTHTYAPFPMGMACSTTNKAHGGNFHCKTALRQSLTLNILNFRNPLLVVAELHNL